MPLTVPLSLYRLTREGEQCLGTWWISTEEARKVAGRVLQLETGPMVWRYAHKEDDRQ